MSISLHKNAMTATVMRLVIRQAQGTEAELALRFGVGEFTIGKRRKPYQG